MSNNKEKAIKLRKMMLTLGIVGSVFSLVASSIAFLNYYYMTSENPKS